MLIGSSGRAYCCVILEHAVLNRMLKADVLDTSLCELQGEWRVRVYFRVHFQVVDEHLSCGGCVFGRAVMILVVVVKCECS